MLELEEPLYPFIDTKDHDYMETTRVATVAL